MKRTLEQLKAMNANAVMEIWTSDQFPFDYAVCGKCLTMHAMHGCSQHPHIAKLVKPIRGNDPGASEAVTSHLEELYALRLFFDSVYPQTTPELFEAIATQEARAEVGEKNLIESL